MKRKEMIVAIKEALKDRNRVSRRIPIECKKGTVQNWAIYFNNEKSFFVLRDRDTDKDFFVSDITIKGLQALAEALEVFLPKEEEAPEIEPKEPEPEGNRFNDLLCTIAFEYAEKFGYKLVKDSIWNKEAECHPLSIATNAPLRNVEFDGESDEPDGKYPPCINVRQRFGSPRLDMYWPKEGNRGRLAFVGIEFKKDGTFSEAQVFYEPGVELFPKLLSEIKKRWEEIK